MTLEELQAEHAALKAKREQLEKEAIELQQQIARLSGVSSTSAKRPASKKPARKQKRSKG
jgi:cell division protein FtsB